MGQQCYLYRCIQNLSAVIFYTVFTMRAGRCIPAAACSNSLFKWIFALFSLNSHRLIRFEKTNEMLSNCCLLSAKRLERAKKELTENKELILQMKSDLESVFRRIRIFKQDLVALYPDICKQFGKLYSNIETDERGGTKKVQIFFMFDF